MSVVFHNQGLQNVPRRLILEPASPFLSFEQMALHYRKSCQFRGGILHRGDCHFFKSSDCSVVRSENLREQKARVPAGDGSVALAVGTWPGEGHCVVPRLGRNLKHSTYETEKCSSVGATALPPQKTQSPLSPGSWLLSAAAALLSFSVVQK